MAQMKWQIKVNLRLRFRWPRCHISNPRLGTGWSRIVPKWTKYATNKINNEIRNGGNLVAFSFSPVAPNQLVHRAALDPFSFRPGCCNNGIAERNNSSVSIARSTADLHRSRRPLFPINSPSRPVAPSQLLRWTDVSSNSFFLSFFLSFLSLRVGRIPFQVDPIRQVVFLFFHFPRTSPRIGLVTERRQIWRYKRVHAQ